MIKIRAAAKTARKRSYGAGTVVRAHRRGICQIKSARACCCDSRIGFRLPAVAAVEAAVGFDRDVAGAIDLGALFIAHRDAEVAHRRAVAGRVEVPPLYHRRADRKEITRCRALDQSAGLVGATAVVVEARRGVVDISAALARVVVDRPVIGAGSHRRRVVVDHDHCKRAGRAVAGFVFRSPFDDDRPGPYREHRAVEARCIGVVVAHIFQRAVFHHAWVQVGTRQRVRAVAVVGFQVLDAARAFDIGNLHVADFDLKFALRRVAVVVVGDIFYFVRTDREERARRCAGRRYLVHTDFGDACAAVHSNRLLPVDVGAAFIDVVVDDHVGRASDEVGGREVNHRNCKVFCICAEEDIGIYCHCPCTFGRPGDKCRNFRVGARSIAVSQTRRRTARPVVIDNHIYRQSAQFYFVNFRIGANRNVGQRGHLEEIALLHRYGSITSRNIVAIVPDRQRYGVCTDVMAIEQRLRYAHIFDAAVVGRIIVDVCGGQDGRSVFRIEHKRRILTISDRVGGVVHVDRLDTVGEVAAGIGHRPGARHDDRAIT